MSEYSQSRIERKISEAINTMIVKGEIKNQKVGKFVSVSRLEVSSDNAYAKIFISSLFDDEEKLNASVKALQGAAPFIQKKLARLLNTRNTPRLTFYADTSYLEAQKINSLIDSLKPKD